MREIQLKAFGTENLITVEVDKPEPGPGEILIKFEAASINPRDAQIIAGEFGYAGFVYGALCLYLLTGIGLLWLPENFLGKVSEEVDAQKAGGVKHFGQ